MPKSCQHLQPKPAMSYQAIEANRAMGRATTLCRALDVSVSGYYDWRGRDPSPREQADADLLQQIRVLQQQGRGLYGSDPFTKCSMVEGSSAHISESPA